MSQSNANSKHHKYKCCTWELELHLDWILGIGIGIKAKQ